MAGSLKLNPDGVKELRTMNPRLVSYNVEMPGDTGGMLEIAPGSCTFIAL